MPLNVGYGPGCARNLHVLQPNGIVIIGVPDKATDVTRSSGP